MDILKFCVKFHCSNFLCLIIFFIGRAEMNIVLTFSGSGVQNHILNGGGTVGHFIWVIGHLEKNAVTAYFSPWITLKLLKL